MPAIFQGSALGRFVSYLIMDSLISTRGADRVVADEAQTHCPGLERLVPSCPTNRFV